MPALTVETIDAGRRAMAARCWRAVEAGLPRVPLTRSWTWTSTWLDHYGDLVPHRFLVARRNDGSPCGATLLTHGVGRRRGPVPVRTLHLGTAGEPPREGVYAPYLGPLVTEREAPAFAAAILAEAAADGHWDELSLEGLDAADAEAFRRLRPQLAAEPQPSPWRDLAAVRRDGGDVVAALPPRVRSMVRRALRGFGEVRLEVARTPGEADDVLDELAALHAARWRRAGEDGVFGSERFAAFHRALAHALLPDGRSLLVRAAASGAGTIGCLLCHVDGGRVLFFQSGVAEAADPRLKPGYVTHALAMQHCLEADLDAYDMLAGDSRYKRELCDRAFEEVRLLERRRRPRTLAIDGLKATRRLVRA